MTVSHFPKHNYVLGYRADIDGLRAIAVLLVVLYHAFPAAWPGGFIGVSVFFVISGYLISGIIFKRLRGRQFSLLDFYARRSRRIAPALVLVLAATWVAGRYLLWADEFKSLGNHVLNSAFFVENMQLARETNYFDVAADYKPLLHFWSLGIEEQFYLIWPIVLVLCCRGKRRWGWLAIGGLGFLSLAYKLSEPNQADVRVFYHLPARFWELMLGGALAYYEFHRPRSAPSKTGLMSSFLGVGALVSLIAYSLWFDPRLSSHRWYMAASTLLPTIATFALIALGSPRSWLNRAFLSLPTMTFIGKVSYPFYLWHWVVLSFLRIHYSHLGKAPPDIALCSLAVLCSFALAWLTYRFVELPAQHKLFAGLSIGSRNWAYVTSALGALVLLGALGGGVKKGIFLTRDQKRQETLLDAYGKFKFHDPELGRAYRDDCNLHARKTIDPSCYTPRAEKHVFIWGDSHAQHLNFGLKQALPTDVSLLQVASSLCEPSVRDDRNDSCNKWNAFAIDKIRITRPEVVILGQDKRHEATNWTEIAHKLKSFGVKHVIVVGPMPQWQPDLYQIVARRYLDNVPKRISYGTKDDVFKTNQIMKERYSSNSDFVYVSLIDLLCEGRECLTQVGSNLLTDLVTIDYGHLSLAGSTYVSKKALAPIILKQLQQ